MNYYEYFRDPVVNEDWETVGRLLEEEGRVSLEALQATSRGVLMILMEEGITVKTMLDNLPDSTMIMYVAAAKARAMAMELISRMTGQSLGSESQDILDFAKDMGATREDCAACDELDCPNRTAAYMVH